MSALERFRGRFLFSSANAETVRRLSALIDDAQWICVATGYGRTTGLDLLPERFFSLVREGRVWILSGDRRDQLSREFVERVHRHNRDALRVLPHRPTWMHAKVWIIQPASPDHTAVLTGSWNLTRSGLSQNDDVGAWLVTESWSPEVSRLRTWFRERWESGYRPTPEHFLSQADVGADEPDPETFARIAHSRLEAQAAPRPTPAHSPVEQGSDGRAPLPAPFSRTTQHFAQIARALIEDPSVAQRVNTLFGIRLSSPDSVWTLDLRAGRAEVREGAPEAAECIIEMRDADFQELCDGRIGREQLFFRGGMLVHGEGFRAASLDFRALAEGASEAKEQQKDEDVDPPIAHQPAAPLPHLSLEPFQQEAIAALRKIHAAEGDGFVALLTLPTGGGKTRVAVWWLLEDFVAKGGRVLWLAHRGELIEQAESTFDEHASLLPRHVGLRVSHVNSQVKDVSGNVILASTMTLLNNAALLYEGVGRLGVDAICFDEAHHATAAATKDMLLRLRKRQKVPLLGLTATPYRADAGTTTFTRDFFEARRAYQRTFAELVALKFLAEPTWDYLTLPAGARRLRLSGDDIAEIRRRNEFTPAVLRRVAHQSEWNNAIVDQWCSKSYGQTIVFASNLDHIKELGRVFERRAGVATVGISFKSRPEERKEALRRFAAGEVPVIINVGILTEGADIDGVKTVVMARPTLSRILYRQMIGRAARRGRDRVKDRFFVLDCVQNSLFHHDTDLHLAGDEVRAELEAL